MTTLPTFHPALHGQLGDIFGVPVYESSVLRPDQVIALDVPVPGYPGVKRPKLVCGSIKRLRELLWIEASVKQAIESEMGDTLEWLYGTRNWTGSLTFSLMRLMNRDLPERETVQRIAGLFARTTRSEWRVAAGVSIPRQGFGFTGMSGV